MRYTIRQGQQAEVLLLVCHVRVAGYYALEALWLVDLKGAGQNMTRVRCEAGKPNISRAFNTELRL